MAKRKPKRPYGFGKFWTALKEFRIPDSIDTQRADFTVKNGHVLLFLLENDKNMHKTCDWISSTFNIYTSRGSILNLHKRFSSLSNRGDMQVALFDEVFTPVVPVKRSRKHTSTSIEYMDHTGQLSQTPDYPSVHTTPACCTVSSPCRTTPAATATADTRFSAFDGMMNLRNNSSTPRKNKMRRRLQFMEHNIARKTERFKCRIMKLQSKLKHDPIKFKRLNQALKRKDGTISRLKEDVRSKKDSARHKMCTTLKRKVKERKREVELRAEEKYKKKEREYREHVKSLENEIKTLENDKLYLEEQLKDLENGKTVPIKKDGRTYSDPVRLIVYDMLSHRVATANIPSLMRKIAKRLGVVLDVADLHRTTVEEMARELGAIADLQAAETAIAESDLTLGFDATTQCGHHVNEVHLTTISQASVVAVDELPGGTAQDYCSHITDAVDNMAATFSEVHSADYTETRTNIINNISNSMTDRAKVNHSTVQLLNAEWEKELTELNCHLHPLDSIATSCRSALQHCEKQRGALFGNDCVAANIVWNVSKLRYKDGKGDPRAFTTFLRNHTLSRGLIPRYRGNRLHVLFHTCAILIFYYNLFKAFFSSLPSHCGGLRKALETDFSSDTARKEMAVLGIIGKVITGPWMSKFYSSPAKHAAETSRDDISHMDGIKVVRKVLEEIESTLTDPSSLLTRKHDFLGNIICDDKWDSLISVFDKDDKDFKDMSRACLDAVKGVLNRQYKMYLETDITAQLEKETKSARLHNMDAEEMMGMLSEAQRRAPNATMDYHSSLMRSKKNKTMEFLDKMDEVKQKKVIEWAVGRGREKRKQKRLEQKSLEVELSRRQKVKEQKKEDRDRKQREKELQDIELDKISEYFPHLETKQKSDVKDLLTNYNITGRHLCHMWFDENTGKYDKYYGKIQEIENVKKNASGRDCVSFVVGYWMPEETPDDAVDFVLSNVQLAADVISDDLVLQ